MKTFLELKEDLNAICEAFKLGSLIRYITEEHTVKGFKVAKFETETGNFNYFFKY